MQRRIVTEEIDFSSGTGSSSYSEDYKFVESMKIGQVAEFGPFPSKRSVENFRIAVLKKFKNNKGFHIKTKAKPDATKKQLLFYIKKVENGPTSN